jgi:cytochrome c-type biogenesis protein CcmH
MFLWIALTLMIAAAASALTVVAVRRYDRARSPAQPRAHRPLAEAAPWIAIGFIGIAAFAAAAVYASLHGNGPVESAAPAPEAPPAEASAAPHPMGDVPAMIGQLEAQLQRDPGNAEGWRMLGWSYMRTGRPADAAKAYAKAVTLAPGNSGYLSAEGEALATAANGQVTGDAQKAFKAALIADPNDPRARYYLAIAKDQSGDHKGAMADWIALIKSAPPDAPWVAEVRAFVERTARERGMDISAELPSAPAAAPAPAQDQVATANQMPAGDRDAMIRGMVDKLAGELKANPRDADGWVRLMRARMVLGESDKAAEAYRDAQAAFAGAPDKQAALRDQARALGVPGA